MEMDKVLQANLLTLAKWSKICIFNIADFRLVR